MVVKWLVDLTWNSPPVKSTAYLMHCVGKSLAIMAVIQYKGDVSSIVDAINAIPLHLGANDNNARKNHKLCPFAENSWCEYQLAIWHQEPVPHHPNYLSEQAVTYIQGLFTNYKYNDPDFVRKISDGRTSNNNEALHHVLFQMVRKNEQVSNTIAVWFCSCGDKKEQWIQRYT